jgi:hypothetical protein
MKTSIVSGVLILTILFLPVISLAGPNEHFFVSKYQPKPFTINLALARVVIWHPWPFVSVSFGWMLGHSQKFTALQMYAGIKCDGTRTVMTKKLSHCVMVLTPKELAAARIIKIDRTPVWNNQGGA